MPPEQPAGPTPASHESIPFQQSPPSIPAFSEDPDLLRSGHLVATSIDSFNPSIATGQISVTQTPPPRLETLRARSTPPRPYISETAFSQLPPRDSASPHFLPSLHAPRFPPIVSDKQPIRNIGSRPPSSLPSGESL